MMQQKIKTGPITIDLYSSRVFVNEKMVHVTPKEFDILKTLSLNKNTVVSKKTFFEYLYSTDEWPDRKIIDVFMSNLRNKLRDATGEDCIETIWGRGYALRDPVKINENSSK